MANTPKPITREDMYYDYLINGTGTLPKPITRKDQYLYYLCKNGFAGGGGTGEGGTTNYNALSNKPKINGTTLQGELNTGDIGITIPEQLPNPNPIIFGGILQQQTYDGSQAVNVVFPDAEILNESAGTPVGEIISYMGVTAPPNYLICDGTVYQIADYPYLAQHFIDNFGSVNFFGGDGTTTFAVPDLRGEFLRGTGTNGHENQGSGSDVGMHQNATQMPNFGAEKSTGNFYVFRSRNDNNVELSNADSSFMQGTGGTGKTSTASPSTWNSSFNNTVTTRPTNTSVLYCIKYKPTYFAKIGAGSEENA